MKYQKIGVFVTGGIAAYKVPQLVRDFIKSGFEVRVVMTKSATDFVTPLTLATVSKNPVLVDEAGISNDAKHIEHVSVAHWMDLAIVVPATANTIAKLAVGMADNLVTATLLAFNGPKLLVPAMNDQMWLNKQTQANVAHLSEFGFAILPPATGQLAEGYAAVGRMPELDVITLFIKSFREDKILTGKKILVSAGGTTEPIDPVRYLTNRSSGKTGTALANAAAALGASVTLVTTKSLPVLPSVNVLQVSSTTEMHEQMIASFTESDVTIMAAAVSDFRPESASLTKIKKESGSSTLDLSLIQNPDILADLGGKKVSGQYLVGFAAETNDLLENARTKLTKKNSDLIIANNVSEGHGFDKAQNEVTLITQSDQKQLPEADKLALSFDILDFIAQQINH